MSPMVGRERLRVASPSVKLTYDDFVLWPDDGRRHELIDGEHYETPSPNFAHQRILGNLHWLFRSYLEVHPVGRVLFAPFDVVFSEFDVVEPDLLDLSNERAALVITPQNARGVPELVVEIASKSTRKRDDTIKRRLYETSGCTEYWTVDPDAEVVRVYRRDGIAFARVVGLSRKAGDAVTTDLLPGIALRLVDIFGA
jgi:Uma2 family endonuclease